MRQTITGFHQDEHQEWVAELSCGHQQHMRHNPPWQERAWVESQDGREAHAGTPIECRPCDEET